MKEILLKPIGVLKTPYKKLKRRPNPIGITIAEILKINDCEIVIKGVDMLDGTPVLDIKPYVKELNPI